MTFSAVLPCFNDARRLADALASLRAQTVPFDDVVVVDDASSDGSAPEIAALVAAVPRARLIRNERNLGVVGALNAGIDAATGDHVFLGSSNDTYAPRLVEWAREALASHPGAALVSGNSVALRPGGARLALELSLPQRRGHVTAPEVVAAARSRPLRFAGGASFVSRAALRWAGGLAPELRWSSDWFILHLLALRHGCCVIPEQLSTLDGSPGSYSDGIRRWPEQRAVTLAFLDLLRRRFPDDLPRFRAAAVLPRYSFDELALILSRPEDRAYVTPLLARRCAVEAATSMLRRLRRTPESVPA